MSEGAEVEVATIAARPAQQPFFIHSLKNRLSKCEAEDNVYTQLCPLVAKSSIS